jgi:tRNA-specific 2-thiouridylase
LDQVPKTFVAMSGGVDSSVAAYLLQQAGHQVVGLHMHLWCEEKQGRGAQHRQCCNADDVKDAEAVCAKLGIPFYVLNFQTEFREFVVDYFCREYGRGRTPNPCLACNEHIKFGLLVQRVRELGGDYLATGHYARNDLDGDTHRLLKGIDASKDQSYFLYMLGQLELRHLQFPVGGLTKSEVRRLAAEAGLPVAQKADSVEICFVADGDYRPFVTASGQVQQAAGDIADQQGNVLGRHDGLACYTVGQRHGVGLGGGRKWYVIGLDVDRNVLLVGPEEALYNSALLAGETKWVSGHTPSVEFLCQAKIRYRSPVAEATVLPGPDSAVVRFWEPQRAITPGQAVVFYLGDEVIGGGIIEKSLAQSELGPMSEGIVLS